MTFDVYISCPCGSGKKLKFCCHEVLSEMDKVQRLQESEQPRSALQALEKLDKSHPGNAWVAVTRGMILLGESQGREARDVLQSALQLHPENDFILGLYALASYTVDGYGASQPVIQRAFQRCAAHFPQIVSALALGIADFMFAASRPMAARQHLALAMRFSSEKGRQNVFMRLMQFDGNRGIPYPLRNVYHLAEYAGADETRKDAATAVTLSSLGCWSTAAKVFARLAGQDQQSAALWQNLGLCRAWNGDQAEAAEALHRAARLHADYATAVDCETLAQVLDLAQAADRVRSLSVEYRVKSVSRLLTLLAEHDRIVRLPGSPAELEEFSDFDQPPVALVEVLDRAPGNTPYNGSLGPDQIARMLTHVTVFDTDADAEIDARLVVSRFDTDDEAPGQQLFESVAAAEIEPVPRENAEYLPDEISWPRAYLPLQFEWHFPPRTPGQARREFLASKRREFINDVWPRTSLTSLGGKTPLEAAGQPELKVPLMAAVFVLDALSNSEQPVDLDTMAARLNVELPPAPEIAQNLPLNSLSLMRLRRLPIRSLSDAQLTTVLNRALLVHHPSFLYDVLVEVLSRPACAENVNLGRTYSTLVELARGSGSRDAAFEWAARGKKFAETCEKEEQFEARLTWTMHELSLRLDDPEDPAIGPLLRHIWEYYLPKLPGLESTLLPMLDSAGVAPPQTAPAADMAGAGHGSTTPGGIWTPQAAAPSPEAGGKLWLPGQE